MMETKAMDKLVALVVLLLLVSCGNADIKYQDIDGQAWQAENQLHFTIAQSDLESGSPMLYLRHTDDYQFQNLWLKVSLSPKDSTVSFERQEIQLAEPNGRWIGKKGGAIYSLEFPLENVSCPADTCELIIEQNMRANPLVGVQSVGVGF